MLSRAFLSLLLLMSFSKCTHCFKSIVNAGLRHTRLLSSVQNDLSPKEKRRLLKLSKKGLAKNQDRGEYTAYQPRPFKALSGLPDKEPFTVLGIETSCDDTGVAIVSSDGRILGEALASQDEISQEWGGVVPGLARDAHQEALDGVLQQALERAGMDLQDVDAVACTTGPGLEICLRVGTEKARNLLPNKPYVAVHHLEAHICMARLESQLEFPFLALLVSGGHCLLLECQGIGLYKMLGGTLDDSLGEAYDKTARLLGLPVGGGGGPALEALALDGDPTAFCFSVPLQSRKDCDFSFSGLKSNVRRAVEGAVEEHGVQDASSLPESVRADVAASFQHTAIRHLEQRVKRAMDTVASDIKTLAVVGGVAANQEVRSRLQVLCEEKDWKMEVPPPRLCTDQGTMAAWAGVERLRVGSSDDATDNRVFARYPFAANEG